jgi:UDP-galactopyranose mutase
MKKVRFDINNIRPFSEQLSGKVANAIIREVKKDIPKEFWNIAIGEITEKLIKRLKFMKKREVVI